MIDIPSRSAKVEMFPKCFFSKMYINDELPAFKQKNLRTLTTRLEVRTPIV